MGRVFERYHDQCYFVLRMLIGLLFAQHGAQKLFGWFGGQAQPLASLMGVAGVVELVGGLLIAIGLFTRPAALVSAVQMVVAYFTMHFPQGWVPIMNKGELALLFLAAFLIIIAHGAGKWGLEKKLFGKERV